MARNHREKYTPEQLQTFYDAIDEGETNRVAAERAQMNLTTAGTYAMRHRKKRAAEGNPITPKAKRKTSKASPPVPEKSTKTRQPTPPATEEAAANPEAKHPSCSSAEGVGQLVLEGIPNPPPKATPPARKPVSDSAAVLTDLCGLVERLVDVQVQLCQQNHRLVEEVTSIRESFTSALERQPLPRRGAKPPPERPTTNGYHQPDAALKSEIMQIRADEERREALEDYHDQLAAHEEDEAMGFATSLLWREPE